MRHTDSMILKALDRDLELYANYLFAYSQGTYPQSELPGYLMNMGHNIERVRAALYEMGQEANSSE